VRKSPNQGDEHPCQEYQHEADYTYFICVALALSNCEWTTGNGNLAPTIKKLVWARL
jgi:hypothetical protein